MLNQLVVLSSYSMDAAVQRQISAELCVGSTMAVEGRVQAWMKQSIDSRLKVGKLQAR